MTNYSLNLNQVLFTAGGRMGEIVRAADYAMESVRQSLMQAQQTVTYDVASAYYNVLRAQKLLDIANERLANLNKHLTQTKAFNRASFATESDVLRVETDIANREGSPRICSAVELNVRTRSFC